MNKAKKKSGLKRVPVSGNRDVLTVSGKEDGYIYRWVNDVESGRRISKFERAGYTLVPQDGIVVGDVTVDRSSKEGRASVTSESVGDGITSYLMRTTKEYYDEDQASKQKSITDKEVSMKRKLNSGEDGNYGGFNIT